MAGIKVGATSWTEKSLLSSGWYPRGANDAASRLRAYASRFSIVENDSAYYAIPSERQAELWCERTPEGFTMNVKAFAPMTRHYTDPKRLPADIRRELGAEARDKRRLYPKDLGPELLAEIARRFRVALEPLRACGRLGVVLFQYPVWFPISRANQGELARLPETLPGCRIAVEFRNSTWIEPRNRARVFDLLRAAGLAYTSVDEPQGFPSSVPPVAEATTDIALVRFHGRNRGTWEKSTPTAAERFGYLYTLGELRSWVPKIGKLAARAREVHVLMNNCQSDHAVVNAKQMRDLLERAGLSCARPSEAREAPWAKSA
jgi:uncharacterized protein YecE (DUF72 family)